MIRVEKMEGVRRADYTNNAGIVTAVHDMFCERKGVGGAIANKGDTTPGHEGDDDTKAEKKDETDAIRGGLETVGTGIDSINTFGCGEKRGQGVNGEEERGKRKRGRG
jgi:hypothetical protein